MSLANTLFPPPPDYYKQVNTPPRADWVAEDGRWLCFGQEHQLRATIKTAADHGLLAADDMSVLLDSFLETMLLLVKALTQTARDPMEMEQAGWKHQGDQYIQHLSNLAATIMVLSNQLRSVQAEATLVVLMEKQLQERRAQTTAIQE